MADLLAPMVTHRPQEPALLDERGALTWAELDGRVDRWAGVLREAGLSVGDRVALVLGNRRETFEVLLACLHTGLVAVPVNWHLTPAELAVVLADSGSRAVVTEAVYAGGVTVALDRAGLDSVPHPGAGSGGTPDGPAGDRCSGGILLYTSGTSGRPRGVLTRVFRVGAPLPRAGAVARAAGAALGIPTSGRALLVGPWYHSAQLFFATVPLLRGCTLVLRRHFDPVEVLALVDRDRIGLVHLVPTQFGRLLRVDPAVRAAFRGDSLVRVWHGGSPCPPAVKRAMLDWWGPVLVEYYGSTETGVATLIDAATWLARPGSVGRALPPAEVVVLGADGAILPPGAEGRVGIRCPGFRYHEAPEATAAAHVAPGVVTVGDLGHLDEDGFLFLTARSAEIIVSGGVNISPAEVEAVLLAHPAVRDAAVVGAPDDEFGEQVRALVEVEPGARVTADELDRHCRTALAGFKVPRAYDLVPHLPREPTGKLPRQAFRERYWREEVRRI